jgi:hypothetical protein
VSETWSTPKQDETLLQTFENRVLRRIYGPCIPESWGEWRLRTSKELYELFQLPP